ncbi:MAG: methyl-accepting chemotaxis protein [Paenibacillaceae bacterium]
MFGWIGLKNGLPLWWSYRLNARLKVDVEHIFEGIAQTRVDTLVEWTTEYWAHLNRLLGHLQSLQTTTSLSEGADASVWDGLFSAAHTRASSFSEIFMLDKEGTVTYSTYSPHQRQNYGHDSLFSPGLLYSREGQGRNCLFGPYGDPLTLTIGPSTSSFHDKMTLMFIVPIMENGRWGGALCGRVPNDVIGDLIQRESGHVYPDSGDNYIFMAQPELNGHIHPGTALSRSRFEDRTFTHGENLKDGVRTDWGVVSIQEHTELEIMFTDPATQQLHLGVAGTIKNGSNLFVEFPGYSDYRHIPVIGKGVTFQLPHCPDVWGMMCEGDLEEVYRIRGLGWRMLRLQLPLLLSSSLLLAVSAYGLMQQQMNETFTALGVGALSVLFGLITARVLHRKGTHRHIEHLDQINRFIRINAEGKGDLTQRLVPSEFDNDESQELAKWINNMIDSLEGIMLQVKQAAADVQSNQQLLDQSTDTSVGSTERMSNRISDMIRSIRSQLKDIDLAKDVVGEMRITLRELESKASGQIGVAQNEVERIGDKMFQISSKVAETNKTIITFMDTTKQIQSVLHVIDEISTRTNLLALNASIEAARVGEHGRGFAVVAGEIRKLADLTRKSTEEIHGTVDQIYINAQEAISSMEEGTQVVAEGTRLVAATTVILNEANTEDSLKTQVVDDVVILMEKIANVSKDNRKISSEVESRVQELLAEILNSRRTSTHVVAITDFLQQLVNQFQLTDIRKS